MTEVTELPTILKEEAQPQQIDQSRILTAQEQIGAAQAAESAWGNEQTFIDTKGVEVQHVLGLIEALNKGEITAEQFANTVGSRMAEKVVAGEFDDITQGDNRVGGNRKSIKELTRAVRYQTPTTGFMIDLDGFKPTNDTLGHLAGDQALFAAANHIRSNVREYDIPYRWGGDEFFITLSNIKADEAVKLVGNRLQTTAAESIREQMEGMGIQLPGDITFSVGAAEDVPPTDQTNPDAESRLQKLTDLADKAAMVSKFRGKNRITIGSILNGVEVFKDPITNEQFTAEFETKEDGSRGKLVNLVPYKS